MPLTGQSDTLGLGSSACPHGSVEKLLLHSVIYPPCGHCLSPSAPTRCPGDERGLVWTTGPCLREGAVDGWEQADGRSSGFKGPP